MDIIYIIIATFNGKKWANACLSSIRGSTIPLMIIVVDNGSTDGTGELIKNQFPDVDIIQLKNNLGFGQANNIGIKKAYHAGADYIFLLNQDAWLEPSAIEKLISAHKNHPGYDIISPMHLNGKGNALDYWFSIYIAPGNCEELYSDIVVKNNIDRIYNALFINAAGWLMTRNCITKIGGFNPSFCHYSEDNNYLHRLRYFGLELGVYPKSCIFHDRENRPINMKYESEMEIYKRLLILNISNPHLKATFFSELKNLYQQLFVSLVKLQFSRVKKNITKISIVYNLDKTFILENKKKGKHAGLTFLE